jgi:hypothetical protein
MSRLFNPNDLLSQNLAEGSTRRDPLPAGEVIAQIAELKFSDGTAKKQGPNFGNPWSRLDCKLEITDPEYLAQIPGAPDKAVTSLGIMLDMDNGQIQMGPNKNIRLNRLREAAGVNGQPLGALMGQFIRVSITHKPHPTESDVVLDEVTAFTKA